MSKLFTIYKHICPNGKLYIGQTCCTTEHRWGLNGNGYKGSPYFYKAILKYGWENIMHEILATDLTKSEADWLEQYLISFYQTRNRRYGYNLQIGGGRGNLGLKLPKETRIKMSRSAKGKKKSLESIAKRVAKVKGIPLSEETKRKLSESRKGKPSWNKGKHLSDKHKIELSKSSLNRKDISKQVKCVETNIIYESAYEAARQTGLNPSHISACRNGKRLTCGGLHWIYVEHPHPQPEYETPA